MEGSGQPLHLHLRAYCNCTHAQFRNKSLELYLMPLVGFKSFSALVVKIAWTVICPVLQRKGHRKLAPNLPSYPQHSYLSSFCGTILSCSKVAPHPFITRHEFRERVTSLISNSVPICKRNRLPSFYLCVPCMKNG